MPQSICDQAGFAVIMSQTILTQLDCNLNLQMDEEGVGLEWDNERRLGSSGHCSCKLRKSDKIYCGNKEKNLSSNIAEMQCAYELYSIIHI